MTLANVALMIACLLPRIRQPQQSHPAKKNQLPKAIAYSPQLLSLANPRFHGSFEHNYMPSWGKKERDQCDKFDPIKGDLKDQLRSVR